jgi:AraC-like DNA-binding protein
MRTSLDVRYWSSKYYSGLEACFVNSSTHVFPKHIHDDIYAAGMMHSGGSYYLGPENSDSVIMPGEVMFINPSQVHTGIPLKGRKASYSMIYFKKEELKRFAAEIFEDNSKSPEFDRLVSRDTQLYGRLNSLLRFMISGSESMEFETGMLQTASALLNFCEEGQNVSDRLLVRKAKELFRENLSYSLSLEEAALELRVNRFYLLRIFKKEVGVPPHVYRTGKRIELAKQLIRKGTSLAETALEAGFADQAHFTRKFRNFTGSTPSQYSVSI